MGSETTKKTTPWFLNQPAKEAEPERGSKLDYALRYAEIGWAVFPCHHIKPDTKSCSCGRVDCQSPGKHPLTRHGVKDASTDPAQVRSWWATWPDANIAVACGAVSGIIVMDVDPRNGGDLTLEDIRSEGAVPDDCHAQTGGGGWHFVYRYPGEGIQCRKLRGIDFQSDGKYIIVEPSTHVSGVAYAWESESDPLASRIDLPEMPGHLVESNQPENPRESKSRGDEYIDPKTVTELRSALNALDADDRETWIACGHRLKALGNVGRELWMTWSQTSEKWQPQDARQWDTFRPTQTDHRAIFTDARAKGWVNPQSREAQPDPQSRPVQKLVPVSLASFKGQEVKPREWLVDGWFPGRETTALYADGGTGKTLLVQQLMTCAAAGFDFFGLKVKQGPTLGIFCEDENDEIHRRQIGINNAFNVDWDDLNNAHSLCRVGSENLLMTFDSRGRGELTTFWHEIRELVADLRPVMMALDTRTDAYGGNESDRHQANEFVKRALTSLAKEFDMAVILTAHPSVTGMTSGMGTSGSTAWNGSVRSRTYLSRDPLTNRITLELKKANYGPTGSTIDMFWHEGALIPYADASGLLKTTESTIDQLTYEFIQECAYREINISADKRGNYAPTRFVQMAKSRKLKTSVAEFEQAIERLFTERKITLQKGFGDTKGRTIAPADPSASST
jgi:RecA-family ATPase